MVRALLVTWWWPMPHRRSPGGLLGCTAGMFASYELLAIDSLTENHRNQTDRVKAWRLPMTGQRIEYVRGSTLDRNEKRQLEA